MNADYTELEMRRLKAEVVKLRAALRINGRHSQRIQRAYDTALLLAKWHIAHQSTGRQSAREGLRLSQRQWQNAMALLKLARVCDQSGQWRYHDLPTIDALLNDGVVAANAAPEAYFSKGNKHMQQ